MPKGKITRMTAWGSGKGFFIEIDGVKPDYMFYGTPKAKVGEEVSYELGKPTNNGNPKIAKLYSTSLEAFVDEDKPNSAPIAPYRAHDQTQGSRETYWAAKELRDKEREPIITRLSCISSAAQVYSGAQGQDDKVLALAAKFEAFAKGEKV